MKNFIKRFILTLFLFTYFANSFAQENNLKALWYYKEEERSRKSFFENVDKIDIFAPQVYFLKKDGKIEGELQKDILEKAKEKNVLVMPLLANIVILSNGKEYFDMNIMKNLLNDKKNWQKVSDFMRIEGKKNGFYGWQLDLEHIDIKDKENFIELVTFLKKELEKDNLKLSAAIVSKISDNSKDYTKYYWNEWAGAYDYKRLGETLDFVSVMAYDQPNSPGPVATIDWTKKVLDYTLQNIPKEKVSFGIPVYSWVYRSQDLKNKKSHFRMVDYDLIQKWINQYEKQKVIKLSESEYKKAYKNYWVTGYGFSQVYGGQSWISYNLNGINYTIWAENAESFKIKKDLIQKSGVFGYSVWVLGDEDKRVWEN